MSKRLGSDMVRVAEVVRIVAPDVRENYRTAFDTGDDLLSRHGITTPLRIAHFLAQVLHETGGLTIEEESGDYSAARLIEVFGGLRHRVTSAEALQLAHKPELIFERIYGIAGVNNPRILAHELGNTELGDGWKYRGRGVLQTTGRGNYRRMGQKCGVDFESNPELVLSAEHALKPAVAEWTEGKLNAAADRDDIVSITRRINGPGMNGLKSRKQWLAKVRRAMTGDR